MGIDCLRTIKTQVYGRLKADDPTAVVPKYDHIRFIGVDTAKRAGGDQQYDGSQKSKRSLDDTEFFSIANSNIKKAISNKEALKLRRELDWFCHETINAPNLGDAGAGGFRQVSRFMMMDKSAAFLSKLKAEINGAKSGLSSPQVHIHIFAGLSGGTGSGCFLDVCYMLKHLARDIGGITLFGYFFL